MDAPLPTPLGMAPCLLEVDLDFLVNILPWASKPTLPPCRQDLRQTDERKCVPSVLLPEAALPLPLCPVSDFLQTSLVVCGAGGGVSWEPLPFCDSYTLLLHQSVAGM